MWSMRGGRSWRRRWARTALLVGGVVGYGCSEERVRHPPAAATRVISLVPSVTDVIIALGAADRLVGRTRYDQDLRVAHLPSIGGTVDPSIERILALEPDLVISWRSGEAPGIRGQLQRIHLPVRWVGTETLDDMRQTIAAVGGWLGLEERAQSLLREIDGTLAAVRALAATHAPVTALYLVNLDPPMAAGPGTFIDDLLTLAGGRNIVADAPVSWPTVSLETIVRRDPDLVVWPYRAGGPSWRDAVAARPGWRIVAAVREGRVLPVQGDLFDRPGPRLGLAARWLSLAFDSIASVRASNTRKP